MSTNNSQIVTDFLQAFMSGNVEKASKMVRDDFSFRAPMHQGYGSKALTLLVLPTKPNS